MRLLVVAGRESPSVSVTPGDRVLTLAGAAPADRPEPDGLMATAEAAGARVRANFPDWLWEWCSTSGALQLAVFDGLVSWWWYAPLSEMSPFRCAFVKELYWLTLVRMLLQSGAYEQVVWIGDDLRVAKAAGDVAAAAGCGFEMLVPLRARGHLWGLLGRSLMRCPYRVLRWLALRALGFSRITKGWPEPDILLSSHFPVLWDRGSDPWSERMFGTWPAALARAGRTAAYAAIMTGSLRQLLREGRELLERCRQGRVWILDAGLPLPAILRAFFPVGLYARYALWRTRQRGRPALYDGLDVRVLLWRELDRNVLGADLGLNRMVAAGLHGLVRRCTALRAAFHPFEYQPIERAFWAGIKSVRDVPVVGVQTGLFTANQMGFTFPVREVRTERDDANRAPVPDYLVAYGELPHRVFSERLGADRVCAAGPLRYPELLRDEPGGLDAFRAAENLPSDAVFVVLATGAIRDEALPLLEWTFAVAAEQPDVCLLLKYHYHLPLVDEVRRLSNRWPRLRYKVFSTNLYSLMRVSRAVVCAGSSVGVEAIACGRMPLVYLHVGQMSHNPMLHVPDAVYFWHTGDGLRRALRSTLARDEEYRSRVAPWPDAIRTHLWPMDGSADGRLFEFLSARGVL